MNQKGNSLIYIILGIILLVLISGGAYYLWATNIQPQVTLPTKVIPTPTIDPTSNWKTYINNKIGFTVKYPDINLKFTQSKYGQDILGVKDPSKSAGLPESGINLLFCSDTLGGKTLKDYVENSIAQDKQKGYPIISPISNVIIDHVLGYKYESTGPDIAIHEYMFFSQDNQKLICITNSNKEDPNTSQSQKLVDQILYTFTFTNPNKIATSTSISNSSQNSINFSNLEIMANSIVDLLVTAPSGQQTGYQLSSNSNVIDIPNSSYYIGGSIADPSGQGPPTSPVPDFSLQNPSDGAYQLQVIGHQSGKYQINIMITDANGKTNGNSISGTTAPGQIDKYSFTLPSGKVQKISN